MENISFIYVILIFIIASVVTWIAGVILAKTTDSLDHRFGFGDAIGGLILLGIAGSLPEIAVVASAAKQGQIPVIIGNLIGGISIQTLVIIIFDFAVRGKKPLSLLAGSIVLSLETLFAIFITALALIAIFIPEKASVFHINPISIAIVFAWFYGLYLINKARKNPRYNLTSEDADPGRRHSERRKVEAHQFYKRKSNLFVIAVFLVAAIFTLIAGVYLELTGTAIANHIGIGAGLFAATAIALVTALPEISTGLESIFMGDNQLAISDIVGGNAFMMVLFLLCDILAKKPILSSAQTADIVLTILGIAMMAVYAISFIRRPRRRYFRLGLDSIIVLLLYIVGLIALVYVK